MRAALVVVLILLMGGCGYHVQGRQSNLPADVRLVFVELFSNATFRPFLENEMSNAATDRFARGRALTMVNRPGRADALLSGVVSSYSTAPISFDRRDAIVEYRATMTVDAALRRPDGKTLWRGVVTWSEDYLSSIDKSAQEDNERAAIRVIAERLADELYIRIVDNF